MAAMTKSSKQLPATVVAMQKIKQLIFSGDLVPDSNHLETELATRLGMSRTPVREATLMLQSQGLLEVQPRRGIKIKALSVEDIEEFYEILIELESVAIRRLASSSLNQEVFKSVHDSLNTMDKALKNQDRTSWSHADQEFHAELVRLGGNKEIERILSNINDLLRRFHAVTLHMRPSPEQSNAEHLALCEAITSKDPTLAENVHRDHRIKDRELLLKVLRDAGIKRV